MEAIPVALGVGFLGLHLMLHRLHGVGHLLGGRVHASKQQTQVQEAFDNMRCQLLVKLSGGYAVHSEAVSMIVFGYLIFTDFRIEWVAIFIGLVLDYPFRSMVSKGFLTSVSEISAQFLLMNVLTIIPAGLAARTTGDALGLDGFVVACRYAVALPAVNTRLIAPPQIVASALAVSQRCNPFFVFREACLLSSMLVMSVLLESGVNSQIEAQFASAEAESMLSGFRRLLRGVCDGEVLLDSQMGIQGEPQCLKHMLMTNTSLHGKFFDEFLNEDEKQRFAKLITPGNEANESSIPPCLRASLRGANDVRVRVDMFHVQVPQYWGARDMYHLIALREDSETQVPARIPMELPDFSKRGPSSRSQRSDASQASSANWPTVPELQEASLLLDRSVEVVDILQAHLRFQRIPQDLGVCQMPCLRGLLRKADWEHIRHQLREYSESAGTDKSDKPPAALGPWNLKLPGKRCLTAGTANISVASSSSPGKLWLHLKDLVQSGRPS